MILYDNAKQRVKKEYQIFSTQVTQTLVNETCEQFYCNGLDFSKQKPDAKSRK